MDRLDGDAEYGVWCFGRKSTTERAISEPDGNGGRRYRKATTTHTATSRGNGADYHYYLCKQRKERRQACDCEQRAVRATEAEGRVWAFVAGLLRDPDRVRSGIECLVEEERMRPARNLGREVGE